MEKEKQQAKKKEKPKYNLLQNVAWMVKMSKEADSPEVGFFVLLMGVVSAGVNIAGLLITPMILKQVEDKAPLPKLLFVIGGYSICLIVLKSLKEYLDLNLKWARIHVRSFIKYLIHEKFCITSYANVEEPTILKRFVEATKGTNSNYSATEIIWHHLELLWEYVICFVVYLYFLTQTNYLLMGIIVITTLAEYYVSKKVNAWSYAHSDESSAYWEKINYISQKGASRTLGKDIRLFGMKDWLDEIYYSASRAAEAFLYKEQGLYLWVKLLDVTLTFLRNGVAYYYLIRLTISGNLSASSFILYFASVGGFAKWVKSILDEVIEMNENSVDFSKIREILTINEPFNMGEGREIPTAGREGYELRLENVSYRYPGAEKDNISEINLVIHPGEKIAIVGLNGAGKTTLIKLMCGLLDPTSGRVLLNGIDIKEFNRRDYYTIFTAVFQQFAIMDISIAENVAQSTEYDEEKIWVCLKKADLEDKIKSLSDGIHTNIGKEVFEDGIELSGGETQRLVLARALYKNAPILLLDEPTAALDPIAEDRIYQRYNEMTKGHTSVFISHRLASTRFCDRILFIENGGIKEEGTHDSLMSKEGKYKKLFDVQSKYYREGSDDNEEWIEID